MIVFVYFLYVILGLKEGKENLKRFGGFEELKIRCLGCRGS